MNDPKISVIIPVYKVEKYLRQCLNSVINQTLESLEIIIIDEGEQDICREIIDEFEALDVRIRAIHEGNGGYGLSVNRGIDLATGQYIAIVESDDWIENDTFEKLYEIASKKDAEVVKANFHNYYENEPCLCYLREILPVNSYGKLFSAEDNKSIFFTMNSVWSAIYKKEFLDKNNIRFSKIPKASFVDVSFTFKVWACSKKVYLLKDGFVHYRLDNENASVKNSGQVFCVCDEYKEIEKFLEQNSEKKELFEDVLFKLKYSDYLWNFKRVANKYKKEFAKQMAFEFKNDLKNKNVNKTLFTEAQWREYNFIANHPNIFWLKYQLTKNF